MKYYDLEKVEELVAELYLLSDLMGKLEDIKICGINESEEQHKQRLKGLLELEKGYADSFQSELVHFVDIPMVATKYPSECLVTLSKKYPEMVDEAATELLSKVHK